MPGGEAAEDARLEGFVGTEAEIGFEAGQAVGRKGGAGFDGLAEFVFPVEIVGGDGDEAEVEGFLWVEFGADFFFQRSSCWESSLLEARLQA